MCQPKPGPRCASHARATLNAARAAKDTAEAAHETVRQRMRDQRRAPSQPGLRVPETEEQIAIRDAYAETSDALVTARADYEAALREYETTPSGQKALAEAVERLTLEGDHAGADAARKRLEEATTTRMRQVSDLAAARAQAERLANLTAEEQDLVAAFDHVADQAAQVMREREQHLSALSVEQNRHEAATARFDAENVAAFRAERLAEEAIVPAQEAARAEAYRLYVEAGVSERYASFYANDTLDTATSTNQRRTGWSGSMGPEYARRPLSLKTKRNGPDAPKTAAAKAAAATDERFTVANTALADKIAAHTAAAERRQALLNRPEYQEAMETSARLKREVAAAEADLTQAINNHDRAVGKANRLRAQIAAGAGTERRPIDLHRTTDDIVRQPDGSINAYVYREPSDGFPHGRYLRATGVTTVHGMGPANALVLEDGTNVHAHESYGRSRHGARSYRSGPVEVIVTPAQRGAHPLRTEGVATAGFATFIDSTD